MSRGRDFWSRRRAQVEAEEQARTRAANATARAAQEAEQADRTDAELCEDLDLPDPETMQPGDDFSAFMAKAVPERLRRRALRRLWLSNPVLANVDGLVDYGEDFTDSACVIEGMQTAYQVGRGMTAHVEEMARRAESEAQGEDVPQEEEQEQDEETPLQAVEAEAPQEAAAPHAWAEAATQETEEAAPSRRRMRFAFDDTASRDVTRVSA